MLNSSNKKLLDTLILDQKNVDQELYSAGPYWKSKNSKTILELKKKGLTDFRGLKSGVSTSFSDNLVYDVRNEFNLKGRIIGKTFYELPYIKKIFDAQLKLTSNYINRYLKYLSIIYPSNKKVIELIRKYKFEQTTKFGAIQVFEFENMNYSTQYLQMAYRIDQLSKFCDFNKINSLFEIGGGFGSNIHFLLTNFKNIKKIIYIDIVPNIFVGTQYLKSIFGDKVKDYLYFKDKYDICFEENDEVEIYCLPSWMIERLKTKIDHFHNASSFVEMPDKVIKNYVSYLKTFEIKEISLVSYGSHNTRTTFNPEKLNSFFDNQLKHQWIEGLIKDFDRDLILLSN